MRQAAHPRTATLRLGLATMDRWTWLALGVAVLGTGLRFLALGHKTLWLDEAFSLWMARQSLPDLVGWLIRIDQHPPLYYALLHGWMNLWGDSEAGVRSLSALCSGGSILFFYGAGRRLADARVGLMAATLLALAPFHVRYAQEARMYALLTLTAGAALYLLARFLQEPGRWRWGVGLAVAQAATMLTHNTAAAFFPLALNLGVLALWAVERRQPSATHLPGLDHPGFLRRWLGCQALALLLWSPWSWAFVEQARLVDQEFWILPPTLGTVWAAFRDFNVAHLGAPAGLPLAALGATVGGLLALYGLSRQRGGLGLLLASLFLVPALGELAVSLRRPIFSDRTLIWTTLAYYLLVALGLGKLARAGRIRLAGAALAFLLALDLLGLGSYYLYFQKEEWDAAAAYVARESRPGDLLLFHASWVQLPFDYYLRRYHADPQAPLPERRGLPVDLFDRGVLEPKMSQADLPRLDRLVAGRERVWLIYSHEWYTDPERLTLRRLHEHFCLADKQTFVGLAVYRFEPCSP